MFCHKCGNKVADDASFCHKCGTKVVFGNVSSFSDAIVEDKPTEQSTSTISDVKETSEDTESKEKANLSWFNLCKALVKGFIENLSSPLISKKIFAISSLLAFLFLAIFFVLIVFAFLSELPVVLLVVAAGGVLLYFKYGRKFISKYDAHFASKTSYDQLFKLLSIFGSIAYGVLFFFPWVRVIGQDWLALFGFGNTDGLNPIGLLHFVTTFALGLFNLFGNHIEVESIDPMVVIALIIFIGVLIAPITSLWGNIKNLFYIIVKPDESKLSSTLNGPLEFIIVYYFARSAIQSYITEIASNNWLGSMAGNLYGNLFQLSAVPYILVLLSIMNWYLMKKYICSQTET